MKIKVILVIVIIFMTTGFINAFLIEEENYYIYEGVGNDFIEIEKIGDAGILYIQANVENGKLSIIGYDSENKKTNHFVDTTGSYEGRVALDFDGSNTKYLEIKTRGSWKIKSLPLYGGESGVIEPSYRITGYGDSIIIGFGKAATATIQGNREREQFKVIIWTDTKNVLVDTTAFFNRTVRMPYLETSTYIFEIRAEGEWEMETNH